MISQTQREQAIKLYKHKDLTLNEISTLVNVSNGYLVKIYREEIEKGNLKPRNSETWGKKGLSKKKFDDATLKEISIDYYENGYSTSKLRVKWGIHPMQLQRLRQTYGKAYKRKENTQKKKVLQYDKKGNFIQEFSSLGEAQRHTNIYAQNISKCCNGKLKTTGGFVWKFKD